MSDVDDVRDRVAAAMKQRIHDLVAEVVSLKAENVRLTQLALNDASAFARLDVRVAQLTVAARNAIHAAREYRGGSQWQPLDEQLATLQAIVGDGVVSVPAGVKLSAEECRLADHGLGVLSSDYNDVDHDAIGKLRDKLNERKPT